MRRTTTALLAPLAALAVAGTVGVGPADAHGDDGYAGGHGDSGSPSAEVETSEETSTALSDAGVTVEAIEPATAEAEDDGTTELTFPVAEHSGEGDFEDGQIEFAGGVEFSTESGSAATWENPEISTEDGLVTVDAAGEQVQVLQAVPAEEDDSGGSEDSEVAYRGDDHGDDGEESDEADLVLTASGADALNAVTGADTFAEGDVFASVDGGHDDHH